MFRVQNTSLSRRPFPVDNTVSGWKTFFSIEKSVSGRKYLVRFKMMFPLKTIFSRGLSCFKFWFWSEILYPVEKILSPVEKILFPVEKSTVSGWKILFPFEKILFPVEKNTFSGWKNTVSKWKNTVSGWKNTVSGWINTVFRKCRSGYSRPNNAHSLIAAEQRAELTKASALTPFIMAASVCHP